MQKPNLLKARVKEIKGKIIERKEIREFNKLYKEHGEISKGDFMKIIKQFNRNVTLEATNNVYGVVLPENIGQIVINNAGKATKKSINFKESIEQGKTVYYKNWDTDNNMMKIVYYNNIRNFVKYSKLYAFNPTSCFKKIASAYFKKYWSRCLRLNYKQAAL